MKQAFAFIGRVTALSVSEYLLPGWFSADGRGDASSKKKQNKKRNRSTSANVISDFVCKKWGTAATMRQVLFDTAVGFTAGLSNAGGLAAKYEYSQKRNNVDVFRQIRDTYQFGAEPLPSYP